MINFLIKPLNADTNMLISFFFLSSPSNESSTISQLAVQCEPAEPEKKDMYWNILLHVDTDNEVDESKNYLDVNSSEKQHHGSS